MSNGLLIAIYNAHKQWQKDNSDITSVPGFTYECKFKEWCKNEHGFEYIYCHSSRTVKPTVLDDQKYIQFLLRWA